MTAQFLVGDVYERMRELPDHSFDLIITSPPFLALRSYLPDDHPDKHKEIGSEQTPADYLDVLLALTAEWRRLLAPHGSIAIELGDTYAGSGGAGGDYNLDGLRDGQQKFHQHIRRERRPEREGTAADGGPRMVPVNAGNGWPLDKSLTGIPTLYTWSLAYGRNLLTGQASPAGQWRIRNLKPWIRTNPPVGALGDKERPATSYITVATLARDRWFDLDGVRTATVTNLPPARGNNTKGSDDRSFRFAERVNDNGGAPPLDWWHQVDAIIDNELQQRAREGPRHATPPQKHQLEGHGRAIANNYDAPNQGARGHHVRRALERAGIPLTADALDISPKGYAGAHYAVWPPELVKQLVDEMCPRRVCVQCGEPSRRVTTVTPVATRRMGEAAASTTRGNGGDNNPDRTRIHDYDRQTVGWSDCGCPEIVGPGSSRPPAVSSSGSEGSTPGPTSKWRPGRILDPFVGSGTTLAVATGMARDAVGIDLDARNAHLAEQRCGMFLEVDWGHLEPTTELPPEEIVAAVNEELL